MHGAAKNALSIIMSDTDKDHERAPPVVENDDDKSPGVRRIEAIVSILTRTDMVILYIGLILASYARSYVFSVSSS